MAPVLQVGKLRLREITSLVQNSTARAWWSRDSTPACLPQRPGSAQTRPRLLGGSLFPESASLSVEVAAVTPHISTACTRLAHDHWHPEFEKNRDRPGLLTPSSGFASRACVLIWVISSHGMCVKLYRNDRDYSCPVILLFLYCIFFFFGLTPKLIFICFFSKKKREKEKSVHMSVLTSQLISPSPSLAVSTSPFSMSESLFLLCRRVHQYHFPGLHKHALIHDICFSISASLHSV